MSALDRYSKSQGNMKAENSVSALDSYSNSQGNMKAENSVSALDRYSKSQGNMKAEMCAVILLTSGMKWPNHLQWLVI